MFDFLFKKRRAMREELARKEAIKAQENAEKQRKANALQAECMAAYSAPRMLGIRNSPNPMGSSTGIANANQQNILLDPLYAWMPGNVFNTALAASPSPAPSPGAYECPAPSPSYEAPSPSPSYDSSSSYDSGSSSSCSSSD